MVATKTINPKWLLVCLITLIVIISLSIFTQAKASSVPDSHEEAMSILYPKLPKIYTHNGVTFRDFVIYSPRYNQYQYDHYDEYYIIYFNSSGTAGQNNYSPGAYQSYVRL